MNGWLRSRGCGALLLWVVFAWVGTGPAWAQNEFPASGNVGIGTSVPAAPLHVGSVVRGNQRLLQIGEPGYPDTYGIVLRGDPADGVFKLFGLANSIETLTPVMSWGRTNGRVGIGTAAPAATLHVGTGTAGNQKVLEIGEPGFPDTHGLVLRGDSRDGVFKLYGLTNSVEGATPIISFARTNGRVGIGTTSPQAALHVAGDAVVDGNIAAKYQDVAEWVRSSAVESPGTVVIIDAGLSNHVAASTTPYDTRVAGVVSSQPGVLLGDGGEGKLKIAHSGRVKVKVDAQYGAIRIGDLLVTSPTPGYAMRSQPVGVGEILIHRPGTLVGKALEPLDQGRGEILVLLTLQ